MLNATRNDGQPGGARGVLLRDATDDELRAALAERRITRGRTLRERRLALGLGLREAARKALVDEGYLSKVERGLHTPSRAMERKLARAYGCKIADLYQPVPVAGEPAEAGEAA